MEPLNDNNHFSADHIRKYLEGKLPADEMHALEKAALDDPFLADAIEGMAMAFENEGKSKVISELELLKQQWAGQEPPAERKPAVVKRFNWWKPAAAAAVIVVAGWVSYQLWLSGSQKNELAVVVQKQETAQPLTDSADALTKESFSNDTAATAKQESASSTVPEASSKDVVANKTIVGKARIPATVSPSPKKTDPVTIPLEKTYNDQTNVITQKAEDKPGDTFAALQAPRETEKGKNIEVKRSEDLAGVLEKQNAGLQKNAVGMSNYFNGQVVDENNKPISNAIVQLRNTKNAYVTDKNGQFNIPSPDTVIDVAVNSVGYNTQNFKLKNTTNTNQLVLQPNALALSEVVVTGYGTQRKKDMSGSRSQKVIVQDAQPVSGWMEFEKYIEKNKRAITEPSAKTGNAVISFIVNKKGELSNFKIETSLSDKQDQEAIRLIKEGPAWKLLKGRKARATVIVNF